MAAVIVCAASTTSCSKSILKQSSPVYSLVNSEVSNGYLQTDLEIKGRLTGEVSGKFGWGGKLKNIPMTFVCDNNSAIAPKGIEGAKQAALYKALQGSDCDIILAPVYTISQKGKYFTVKVTGMGAVIKNVEQKEPTAISVSDCKAKKQGSKGGVLKLF